MAHRLQLRRLAVAAGALAVLSMAPAHAMLVLQGPQDFQGSGLGSVNTLLTIQSPGSSSFEEGSVGRTVDGTSDVLTGDAMSGASQSEPPRLSWRPVGVSRIDSVFDLLLSAPRRGRRRPPG
jgi:hypothetical protein